MSETSAVFIEKNQIKDEYALSLINCPVCNFNKFKLLFVHDGFSYYKCRNCTFVFTNPRLNGKGSKIWYNSDYYNAALKKEIYINAQDEQYYSVSLNQAHFKKVVEVIDEHFKDKNISIIDLGCSTGSLLACLRDKYGFSNLSGIDLNKNAIEFAKNKRKLNVAVADITDINNKDKFDLVINTENIEHVNDLNEYIANLKQTIRSNGHLLISTPHNDPKALKLFGLFADHFCAPNHINYFNEKTIGLFLKRHGFEIKYIFIDRTWRFNLYAFLKSKLYVTDQVTAEPPFEAFFKGPIKKDISDRRSLVQLKEIIIGASPSNVTSKSRNSVKAFLKKVLTFPVGKPYKTHLILLAKKVQNEKQ